jgi:hypothetical protein
MCVLTLMIQIKIFPNSIFDEGIYVESVMGFSYSNFRMRCNPGWKLCWWQ